MTHKHTPGPWYPKSGGGGQGIVISETTGANIAVAYDSRDTELIARAPDLLAENEQLRAINADLIAACHLADISEHKLLSLTHQQLINYVRDVRMTAVSATEAIARTKAQS